MDLKTLKLEAITRTAFNLADYSHARRDVSDKKRIKGWVTHKNRN